MSAPDFLSDAKNVASFSDDKTVRVWDTATESETNKFSEHKVIILWLSFIFVYILTPSYVYIALITRLLLKGRLSTVDLLVLIF